MSKKKLLDEVREQIRVRHYSVKTERTYIGWIKRYIFYHQKKHPIDMGKAEIEAFLTHFRLEGTTARRRRIKLLMRFSFSIHRYSAYRSKIRTSRRCVHSSVYTFPWY